MRDTLVICAIVGLFVVACVKKEDLPHQPTQAPAVQENEFRFVKERNICFALHRSTYSHFVVVDCERVGL
jgi:hypothetical protein